MADENQKLVLRVCALYPDLLNIYADRGNIIVLQRRCEWRGIEFQLTGAGIGEEIDPTAHDLFYLGGGQDRDQQLCARDLVETKREALHSASDRGAVIFGVCGGYQLLGEYYEFNNQRLAGIEVVNIHTVNPGGKRLIGNVAIEVDLRGTKSTPTESPEIDLVELDLGVGRGILAGFENHGGRTYLGKGERPLGQIRRGHGNNGNDRGEGVLGGPHRNVVGTYLHGPLLPKNSWFADWLIAKAIGVHPDNVMKLDDEMEQAAHMGALKASGFNARKQGGNSSPKQEKT